MTFGLEPSALAFPVFLIGVVVAVWGYVTHRRTLAWLGAAAAGIGILLAIGWLFLPPAVAGLPRWLA